MAPIENAELTNWRNKRRTGSSDIIGPSFGRDQYTKKTWPFLIFWIYSGSFWGTLSTFCLANPFSALITYFWSFRLSGIMHLTGQEHIRQQLKSLNFTRRITWNDKSSRAIILLPGCSQQDKVTKFLKMQNEKMNFLQKLD